MDIPKIKKLIQLLNENNLGEITVKEGDMKITVRHRDLINTHSSAQQQQPVASPQISVAALANQDITSGNFTTIKAPMIGTFYRSSGEGKEALVKVGDKVKKGDVLCIIEAMKLFNEIQSEVSGKIIKVMIDNAQAVEYDQPLFLVE